MNGAISGAVGGAVTGGLIGAGVPPAVAGAAGGTASVYTNALLTGEMPSSMDVAAANAAGAIGAIAGGEIPCKGLGGAIGGGATDGAIGSVTNAYNRAVQDIPDAVDNMTRPQTDPTQTTKPNDWKNEK